MKAATGCRLPAQVKRTALIAVLSLCAAAAAVPPAAHKNFVACPIVRDTQTTPCWLAEYGGELYFLGTQADTNAEWSAPYLGHRVLVEGVVADDYRICGGIVLKPVVTSPLPELDSSCNSTVLPAEERYTVPFASRTFGRSNSAPISRDADRIDDVAIPRGEAKEFVILYDFDWPWVTGKTSSVLQQVVRYAKAIDASNIEIVGTRGATLLSSGTVFAEQAGIGERRAKQVAQLLTEVGVAESKLHVSWREQIESANGERDFESRRVTLVVKP